MAKYVFRHSRARKQKFVGGNVEIFVGQINSRQMWNCYSALQTSYMYLYENICSLEAGVANILNINIFDIENKLIIN